MVTSYAKVMIMVTSYANLKTHIARRAICRAEGEAGAGRVEAGAGGMRGFPGGYAMD
jgi:hypothetical protein